MENKLDGNVAGGILQEIFPFDMTLALVTCAGCGTINAIGVQGVYMHPMGMIIRCPSCDTVLIRMAQVEGHHFLDMRGVRVLQIGAEA